MKTFAETELEGWEARAGGYADATERATAQFVPMMLHLLQVRPGLRLLDLCCGQAVVAGAAAAIGLTVRAEDFAPSMVGAAQERFPNLDIGVGDAQAVVHPNASFDRVSCNFGLWHLPHPDKAIAEAHRVLRPGGRFAFSQWLDPERSALQKTILGAISAHADMSRIPPAPDPWRFSNAQNCRDALEGAGFEDVEVAEVDAVLPGPRGRFMDFFKRYSVRVTLLWEAQDADVRTRIAEAVEAAVEPFAEGDTIMIPTPGLVAAGRRPTAGKEGR